MDKVILCECGKPARYKCMVVMYPLGVVPRFTKSAPAFGVCDVCYNTETKRVLPRVRTSLASAFANVCRIVQEAMKSTSPASKGARLASADSTVNALPSGDEPLGES